MQTQTEHFFQEFSQPFDIPLKRSSGSMKIDNTCRESRCSIEKYEHLCKQLEIRDEEVQLLSLQCKKMKISLN
jgi:hypothetical protein